MVECALVELKRGFESGDHLGAAGMRARTVLAQKYVGPGKQATADSE